MHFIVVGLAGMKVLLAHIVVSWLLLAPFVWFAATVKSIISKTEDKFGIEQTDMYTMIYALDLSQQLQVSCVKDDISKAQTFVSTLKSNLRSKYSSMSNAEMLTHSRRLYNAIQGAHERAERLNDSGYCTLKYVFYTMQDRLREEHIAVLKTTDIINDFNGFGSSDTIYWLTTKISMLDLMIEENKKYKDLLSVDIAFKRLNNSFKETLSNDAKQVLAKNEVLMALTVYKALYKLVQAGLFNTSDLEELKDKVDFEFVDSCQYFHGKYEIKETIDGYGHHVSYDTYGLHLKVNVCGNYFVLRDLDFIFEKIVTHELAHHFYYYHDNKSWAFEDICRSSPWVRNNVCKSTDFVTDYAQTLSTEDYAEHFMYWFLWLVENTTAILQKKTTHFEQYR